MDYVTTITTAGIGLDSYNLVSESPGHPSYSDRAAVRRHDAQL